MGDHDDTTRNFGPFIHNHTSPTRYTGTHSTQAQATCHWYRRRSPTSLFVVNYCAAPRSVVTLAKASNTMMGSCAKGPKGLCLERLRTLTACAGPWEDTLVQAAAANGTGRRPRNVLRKRCETRPPTRHNTTPRLTPLSPSHHTTTTTTEKVKETSVEAAAVVSQPWAVIWTSPSLVSEKGEQRGKGGEGGCADGNREGEWTRV